MNFLDILSAFSELPLVLGNEPSKKRPRIFIVFYILLVIGIFWCVIEMHAIISLLSPILFLVLFIPVGFIAGVATIILLYKLDLIERLNTRDVFGILIPMILLIVSLASCVNRTYSVRKQESMVAVGDPLHGEDDSSMSIALNGEEVRLSVPKSIGGSLHNGDSLRVEKRKGLLGFSSIRVVANVRAVVIN